MSPALRGFIAHRPVDGNPPKKTMAEFRLLAEQGDANAQSWLGSMYNLGKGAPKDNVQALAWLRKAAERGNAALQSKLAHMYAEGRGVPRDDIQAYMWADIARRQLARDDSGGKTCVGMSEMWLQGTLTERMTPAQIAEARRLSQKWKPRR